MSIIPGIIGTVMPILLQHFTKLAKILTSKKNCVIIKLAPTSTWNHVAVNSPNVIPLTFCGTYLLMM